MYKVSITELKAWKKSILNNMNILTITPKQKRVYKETLKSLKQINTYLNE